MAALPLSGRGGVNCRPVAPARVCGGILTRAPGYEPGRRGAKVSRRRPGSALFAHVANRLCPGTGGPFSSQKQIIYRRGPRCPES